ncbi:HAD family hydrolase [Streptomyces albus]|uniref:HAD family hydrolase n=1 Tax=Streptomyces albus TaxID=1888 RepID=UPI003F1C8E23
MTSRSSLQRPDSSARSEAPAYLHVFDLDGTLMRHTTAALELARQAGCHARVQHLEQELASGVIDHARFAELAHAAWRTQLTADHAQRAFAAAPWLQGMKDVFADIRRRGERSAVLTLGPDTFAHHLGRYADHIIATPYPAPGSRAPFRTGTALRPGDKVTATQRLQTELGLSSEHTIAYGDGPTDQPLFAAVGLAVAINPSPALPADATHLTYRGDDLSTPYEAVRAHFAGRPAAAPTTSTATYSAA